MKYKVLAICKSLLWCFVVLLFPIASGTISVILALDTVTNTIFTRNFYGISFNSTYYFCF